MEPSFGPSAYQSQVPARELDFWEAKMDADRYSRGSFAEERRSQGPLESSSYNIPSSRGFREPYSQPPPEQNWAAYGSSGWSLGMAEAQANPNRGLQASLEDLHRSLSSIPPNGTRGAEWGHGLDGRAVANGWGPIGEDRGKAAGVNVPRSEGLVKVPSYRDVSRDGLKKEASEQKVEAQTKTEEQASPGKEGSTPPDERTDDVQKKEGKEGQAAAETEEKEQASEGGVEVVGSPKGIVEASVDFSSSFPSLFSSKLTMAETDRRFRSFSDLEKDTIGKLLPDNEEDLLAGIGQNADMDRTVHSTGSNGFEEREDFDLFSSGGGLELGDLEGSGHGYRAYQRHIEASAGFAPPLPRETESAVTGPMAGEHPYGEHPSRTLFVRNINSNVEDSELRALFEQYGAIRQLYTACKHRGFVMISYYDIRAARSAMRALQNKPLRRRKLDIHFSIPKENPSDKDVNQGTLVVFNLDSSVTNEELRQIFSQHGEVKEIRETPHKRHHKFIEFYDIRAADAALRALNRSDIAGKRIKLEPSRPGGARRIMNVAVPTDMIDEDRRMHASPPRHNSWSSMGGLYPEETNYSAYNMHPGLSMHSAGGSYHGGSHHSGGSMHSAGGSSHGGSLHSAHSAANRLLLQTQTSPSYLKRALSGLSTHPSSPNRLYNGALGPEMGPSKLGPIGTRLSAQNLAALEYSRYGGSPPGDPYRGLDRGSGLDWAAERGYDLERVLAAGPDIGLPRGLERGLERGYGPPLQRSSTDVERSIRGGTFFVEALAAGGGSVAPSFDPPSSRPSWASTTAGPRENFSSPYRPSGGGSAPNLLTPTYLGNSSPESLVGRAGSLSAMGGLDSGPSSPNPGGLMHRSGSTGHLGGLKGANGQPPETRGRRPETPTGMQGGSGTMVQYQLDLEKILRGEEPRTTLMIKNIPNKYTQKMLLAAIDEHHKGTYDFFYLPIDFKNKCNVGYAFINLVSPEKIVPFCEHFNGKKWEKFNSEKVASLAYARIQGKAALVAHFQNSSLMNEDKRCRPILFHSDGERVGDQEPFPASTAPARVPTGRPPLTRNSSGTFTPMSSSPATTAEESFMLSSPNQNRGSVSFLNMGSGSSANNLGAGWSIQEDDFNFE
ncbi:Protein Mei2 [Klebsormidium nitens]|uniref:Protein Mei2 n=1 Tax=Klebsormidium nitens TaxID=105231 RepID=A0A0U9HJ51_KLENI|nr:Protein Mei2 [Klebsormidium nitens]|eukprot:GAQ81819.1 Protein Mei2 [Klebsormidium nitens]